MKNKINFSRVVCDGNEWTYLSEVLESGWLTSGKMTRKFETLFSEAVGAQFSFAVNSCTAALHLGLESLGVGQGDKVLVPTMTFAATAEVVRYLGADPVFVDVEYGSNLVTPSILEKAIDGNNANEAIQPSCCGQHEPGAHAPAQEDQS